MPQIPNRKVKRDRLLIKKQKAYKPIFDGIEKVLSDLSVPKSFYWDMLQKDDDWSFVVKVHAVIESSITHLLITSMQRPALKDILSRIDISNLSTGKLAFVKALGLLPKKHITFIHQLSTLRNELVHDVRNINFSFDTYFDELEKKDPKKHHAVLTNLGSIIGELIPHLAKNKSKTQYVRENPRKVIGQGSVSVAARIYLHKIGFKIDGENI